MALYIHNKEKRLTAKTVAFLYRWTHLSTGKWYIGSRTAAGCHPNDGYICTSKVVKPMVEENIQEWFREILCIGPAGYIGNLEALYLELLDAKNDPMSFNEHNGNGKFTSAGKSASNATKLKMSISRQGVLKSQKHKEAIKQSLLDGFKNKLIQRPIRKAINNPAFQGYYISPNGEKLTAGDASKEFKVSSNTIRNWGKLNKNGWSFVPTLGE